MLDKSANFIKLKISKQKLPGIRGENSGGDVICVQDSPPIAVTVEEAENVDGLGRIVDFVEQKIVLNRQEMKLKRQKKRIVNDGKARRKDCKRINACQRVSTQTTCSLRILQMCGDISHSSI